MFFKLEYDNAKDMHDHSHLTKPEQVATKAVLHVVQKCLEEHESTLTLDDLSEKYAVKLKIDFDFPQGSGLGSSASFNVVLAGTIYTLFHKVLSNNMHDHSDLTFDSISELWHIKQLADYGEGFLHKSPSGVDTSAVTLGGMIKFVKSDDPAKIPESNSNCFDVYIYRD